MVVALRRRVEGGGFEITPRLAIRPARRNTVRRYEMEACPVSVSFGIHISTKIVHFVSWLSRYKSVLIDRH